MSFVQFLEGNFITPNIVGSKVSINPLAAIIMLLLGGQLWGLPGLILALPLTAILKVILDATPTMEPYGFLLGEPGKEVAEEKEQVRHPGYYRDPEVTQANRQTETRRPARKKPARDSSRPTKTTDTRETASVAVPDKPENSTREVAPETGEAGKEANPEAKKRRRPSRRRKKPGEKKEGEGARNSTDQDS
jgi:hypothetical protein